MNSNISKTDITKWSITKYYCYLFVIYLIAHGGILFIPNAIYWDDWTLYGVTPEVIYDTGRQAGSMFNLSGHMRVAFLSIGPWFYKVLTFVLMFGAAVALDFILKKHKSINTEARFLIVLFFLALPFYWARVALIDMNYTISYFLFFLAWALIDKQRFVALVLFFFSFNTNSLLVFYALPILDMYYRSVNGQIGLKSLMHFSIRKFDFMLLPFFYFGIKVIFYSPSGLFDGYNEQFSLIKLVVSPFLMALDWSNLKVSILPLIFTFGIIFYFFRKHISIKLGLDGKAIYGLYLGLVIFCFGGFPYWILGHVPTFTEWTSRHQLLLPLGSSIIVVMFLFLIEKENRIISVSLLLALCITLNIGTYKDFYLDWQKQKELIELFKSSEKIKNGQLIVFEDNTLSKNAISRIYRSYEWNGLMATAFGNELRLGINSDALEELKRGNFFRGYFSDGEKYRNSEFSYNSTVEVVLVEINLAGRRIRDRLFFGKPLVNLTVTELESLDFSEIPL